MGQLDRVADARRAVQQAALERWRERQGHREAHERQIAAHGPGAADTPQRNARLEARESAFARARELRRLGRLPVGLERRMGATLDWTQGAPSEAARTAGRPVARLVAMAGPGLQPKGFATGFLVAPGLLLTNHHVFPARSDAAGGAANFLYERSERGQEAGVLFELDPGRFFLADERFDFALVAVAPRSGDGRSLDEFGALSLVEATPKVLIGQPVHIIQHPGGGPKQYAFTQNRCLDILDSGFLLYETDTGEGSSGSPAFSDAWELVALHHVSVPAMRDGRILAVGGGLWEPGMPDDQVQWIANEGIRISALVRRLADLTLPDPAEQATLRGLLATTTDPVDELIRQAAWARRRQIRRLNEGRRCKPCSSTSPAR